MIAKNEQASIDSRRLTVLKEIENWKLNPKDRFTWHSELNNFSTNLPSDDYDNQGGRYSASMAINAGIYDVVNEITSLKYGPLCGYNSQLYLSQTPRQFYTTIDEVIDKLPEISLKNIKKLQHEHFEVAKTIRFSQNMTSEEEERENKKVDLSMKYLKELYEYTLPVYVELRVMGYSQYDLTG